MPRAGWGFPQTATQRVRQFLRGRGRYKRQTEHRYGREEEWQSFGMEQSSHGRVRSPSVSPRSLGGYRGGRGGRGTGGYGGRGGRGGFGGLDTERGRSPVRKKMFTEFDLRPGLAIRRHQSQGAGRVSARGRSPAVRSLSLGVTPTRRRLMRPDEEVHKKEQLGGEWGHLAARLGVLTELRVTELERAQRLGWTEPDPSTVTPVIADYIDNDEDFVNRQKFVNDMMVDYNGLLEDHTTFASCLIDLYDPPSLDIWSSRIFRERTGIVLMEPHSDCYGQHLKHRTKDSRIPRGEVGRFVNFPSNRTPVALKVDPMKGKIPGLPDNDVGDIIQLPNIRRIQDCMLGKLDEMTDNKGLSPVDGCRPGGVPFNEKQEAFNVLSHGVEETFNELSVVNHYFRSRHPVIMKMTDKHLEHLIGPDWTDRERPVEHVDW